MFEHNNNKDLFDDLRSLGAIDPYEEKEGDFEIGNGLIWPFNNQNQGQIEGIIADIEFEPMSDEELFPRNGSEIIAYYKPIHFYDEENWGIVIKFRPLVKFSNQVRNFIINNSKIPDVKKYFEDTHSFEAKELSLEIAEEIVLRHEMYHHSLESFAIRTELIRNVKFTGLGYDTPITKPIESFYKRYKDESKKKGIDIPRPINNVCNVEEALANYNETGSLYLGLKKNKRLNDIIDNYFGKEERKEISKLVRKFVTYMHKREIAHDYREVNKLKSNRDFFYVENYLKFYFHKFYKELKTFTQNLTPKLAAEVSPIFGIDEIINNGKLTYEFSPTETSPSSAKAIPVSIKKSKVIKYIEKKHKYREREGGSGGKGSHTVYVKENSPMITFERGNEVGLKIIKQIAVSLNINLHKLINSINAI